MSSLLREALRERVAAAVGAVAGDGGQCEVERPHRLERARRQLLAHHPVRQEAVAQPVQQTPHHLAAVVDLHAEGVAGREQRAHELARLAEGEIAHQVVAFEQFRLADAAAVGVVRGRGDEHEFVRGEPARDKPRLFEREIGKGDVYEVVLQHLQKVVRMPEHDFERDVRVRAVKIAHARVELGFVLRIDRADAQRLFVARRRGDLADEALFQLADAQGVREEELTLLGQVDAALPAHKELLPRLALQLGDAVGHRRLRDVHPLRRAREILQFGKHDERTDGFAVHARTSSSFVFSINSICIIYFINCLQKYITCDIMLSITKQKNFFFKKEKAYHYGNDNVSEDPRIPRGAGERQGGPADQREAGHGARQRHHLPRRGEGI